MFLIISPFDDIRAIKQLLSYDLHIYLIICMKKAVESRMPVIGPVDCRKIQTLITPAVQNFSCDKGC